MKRILPSLISVLVLSSLALQVSAADPLEEYFYSSGKIRVVAAVASIVLLGLIFFIVRLERRVKRLEKDT